jgi:two-component system LytT family response regulator
MKGLLNAVIVDDESKSRINLKNLLEKFCPQVHVQALCQNVAQGLQAIETYHPAVVFLDIQLQGETGFDLLEQLSNIDFEIVFTTAYSDYAIRAFKFSAIDYLLKPIDPDELIHAVEKAAKRNSKDTALKLESLIGNLKNTSADSYRLAVPTQEGLMFLKLKDILYCEAMSNYTCFYMSDGKKYVVSKPLKEYEQMLDGYNFFRIHNSFVVNLREVKEYIRGEGGYVVLHNNVTLDVAKRRKEAFLNRIMGVSSLT